MTKGGESGRIVKLSQITATERQKDHGWSVEKNFKKILKNLLTKSNDCDIIVKRSQREREKLNLDNWTTKDRSTKQKSKCEIQICQKQRVTQL